MRTIVTLTVLFAVAALASFGLAQGASMDTFASGWLAVASAASGTAACIVGGSALVSYAHLAIRKDYREQQIADASLKQIAGAVAK